MILPSFKIQPVVPFRELRSDRDGTPSANMRDQVQAARQRQRQRFGEDAAAGMVSDHVVGGFFRYAELKGGPGP